MVQWVAASILQGGLELFQVPANAQNGYNKGCGMCYPVCGIMHIKDPLLLIKKAHVVAAGFLSSYLKSFIMCPTPYNHK